MLQKIIFWLVKAVSFYKLNKDSFDMLLSWVRQAETAFEKGEDKSAYVKGKVKTILQVSAPYLVDLLVALAVGYLGKKGEIHLGGME